MPDYTLRARLRNTGTILPPSQVGTTISRNLPTFFFAHDTYWGDPSVTMADAQRYCIDYITERVRDDLIDLLASR